MRTERAIYGIQAKGVDGTELPLDRVEDMTESYLRAIKRRYPEGPYIFIGYSFGGLVALEMAQQLLIAGEIPILIMLETYPHPHYLSSGERRRLFVRRLKSHITKTCNLPLSDAVTYLNSRVSNLLSVGSSSSSRPSDTRDQFRVGLTCSTSDDAISIVKTKAYVALTNYEPKVYFGKVKFVAADIKTFFPKNPKAVWGNLMNDLWVEVTPGDHISMVTEYFECLADVLTRFIQECDYVDEYVEENAPEAFAGALL